MIKSTVSLFVGKNIHIPAPPSFIKSIQSIQVTNTDQGVNGFQIILSTGRSGVNTLNDHALFQDNLLREFNNISIMVTLNQTPNVLINGKITNIQLTPSDEPGDSTITVTGEDIGVMCDLDEKYTQHPNQSDGVIARKIIGSYANFGIIPEVIEKCSGIIVEESGI